MKLSGAEIIFEILLEHGVDTVFGYPGGTVLRLYDALLNYRGRINHILTAHEQGAAFAAEGYARASGKTGVVFATSGPGATNLVTGIADAYMDSVPLVAITGNVELSQLGRDSFQEIDIAGITMPITKYNFIIKDINELADTVRRAFQIAGTGRKGPVLIDIPKNVLNDEAQYSPVSPSFPVPETISSENRLRKAMDAVSAAKHPVIFAGGGVISSGASDILFKLAHKLSIPVVSTMMGLGGYPSDDPLFLGLVGMHGDERANLAVQKSDVLIAAGMRFSERVTGNRRAFAPDAHIIHIDIDPAEHDKNVTCGTKVTGDLRCVLGYLYDHLPEMTHDDWLKKISVLPRVEYISGADGYADPKTIISSLEQLLTDEDIIVTDVGQHQMWTAQFYHFRKPRTFITSGGLGAMGFGLGAAIGAGLACPNRRVVLISGDGSFHMNLNELSTLVEQGLPIVDIVLNNNVLGMVRQWQRVFYNGRYSYTEPHRKTDVCAVARAFGAEAFELKDDSYVCETLRAALSLNKPVVINARISPDDCVLPMIPPGGALGDMIDDI